jgi:hypothetical protein
MYPRSLPRGTSKVHFSGFHLMLKHLRLLKVSSRPAIRLVSVFYTGKNRVVNIACSSSEKVLRTTKHTMIYPSLGPSMEIIDLRLVV